MALRNQPYIPLYIQDYLTDEKLNMCSLKSQGVYVKIMCILHKQKEYGALLLKQKDKQNESKCLNFALKLARLLPVTISDLDEAIQELVDEDVLQIAGDELQQNREYNLCKQIKIQYLFFSLQMTEKEIGKNIWIPSKSKIFKSTWGNAD